MNETADVASNLPAIILFSFWWVLLSMLEFLSRAGPESSEGSVKERSAGGTGAVDSDQAFPGLRVADPEFSTEAFLAGACRAYEEVLRAYALCDAKALQALLSTEVLQAFTDACRQRAASGETLELTFVGIRSAGIAGVDIGPDAIAIDVLFRAEVVQAERSAAGEIIRGDPASVAVVADLWTFSRPRPVGGATWTVVATDEARQAA